MTARALDLAAALLLSLSGCTFCVVHEQSAFERSCRERGGQVRTFATTQTCVTDAGAGGEPDPLRADDAGG